MKLPIGRIRLVQSSLYGITPDGRSTAAATDTHLNFNGDAGDDNLDVLQRVPANTCYLHQTMIQMSPWKVSVRQSGKPLPM